jgi:hypothetical protein
MSPFEKYQVQTITELTQINLEVALRKWAEAIQRGGQAIEYFNQIHHLTRLKKQWLKLCQI